MGKPVRKEKKLLHPKMDAGCFSSFSSGKEFWFSKAVVFGSCGTHSHPPSLAITGKGRQVMRHSTALFGEGNSFIRTAQSFRCVKTAMSFQTRQHQNPSSSKEVPPYPHSSSVDSSSVLFLLWINRSSQSLISTMSRDSDSSSAKVNSSPALRSISTA